MYRLSRCARSALAMGAVALAGCSSTSPTRTGSLTITITPADGTTPSVVITGPNGYNNTISTTQTLTHLTLGNYTVVADLAVGPDSVVGTITDTGMVTGTPASVVASPPAAVTVTYAFKHRVGGLWVGNNISGPLAELAASQLRISGTPVPAETLATPEQGARGLALDANGNMWALAGSLYMYTPAERNDGGAPTPSITLTSTAITDPYTLTLDPHGNLWLTNCPFNAGQLLEFSPAQLSAGGAQTPAVTINGGCFFGIAFDGSGNMWVGDGHANRLVEYSAAQIATAGASTPTPIDTVGANSGSLSAPVALLFDANGNLWVANGGNNTVVEYTAAQLAANGAPAPTTIVTMPSFASPAGLIFDRRGTLWVSGYNNGFVYGLTSGQITTSGAPTPAVAIDLSEEYPRGVQPAEMVFDPYVTNPGVSTARLHDPRPSVAETRRPNANRVRHGPNM